jgi:hypothetical protein
MTTGPDFTMRVTTAWGERVLTAHVEYRTGPTGEDETWVVPAEPVVLANGDTLSFTALGRMILSD